MRQEVKCALAIILPTFQVAPIHTMPFPHTLSALLFQMQNRLGIYSELNLNQDKATSSRQYR